MPARSASSTSLVAAIAIAGGLVCAPAAGQEQDCRRASEPPLAEAIAEAHKYLANAWLAAGDGYYLGFSTKATPTNPFDLAAKGAPPTARGYIWLAGVSCTVVAHDPGKAVTLRFGASAMSFFEDKGPWTKPFKVPKLIDIHLARQGEGWKATEQRDEKSAILPDDVVRRPSRDEVPPADRKLKIPCADDQQWTGRKCIAAKRTTRR